MSNEKTYTGIVKEVKFLYPTGEKIAVDRITLIRFDNEDVIAFHDYQLYIPKNKSVTFKYHFKYNFSRDTPIYELDSFSVF